MSTIAENLQIIKDSTEAIKQAIIDKGGTIPGNITTYAEAINNIQTTEGVENKEITFIGNMIYSNRITLTGYISNLEHLDLDYPITVYTAFDWVSGHLRWGYSSDLSIKNDGTTDTFSIEIQSDEPIMGDEIPIMFFLHQTTNYSVKLKID